MKPSPAVDTARTVVLIIFAAAVLLPFASVILSALHPAGSAVGGLALPPQLAFENFATAWEKGRFSQLMGSSLLVALCVVPLTIAFSTLAGFALAVLRPRGSRWISVAFILGLTLPTELVVVALYYNLSAMGLVNTHVGVILAEIALFLPFGVYWMQTHFASLPRELVESARIDGARDLIVLLRILLPISGPALTTIAVLFFMWSWNQFLLIIVLIQDPSRRTAPAGLGYFVGEHSTDVPLLAAASILVTIPIVIVYLVFQRSFVSGITQGAIKG